MKGRGAGLERLLEARTCIIKGRQRKKCTREILFIRVKAVLPVHPHPSQPASSDIRSRPYLLRPLGNFDNKEIMDGDSILDNPTRHPDLIIPGLYLCDLHTAQDAAVVVALGITHIVSVLDFHPSFPHEMHDIKKMHVRLSDNFREKITPHLDKTTAFIRDALENDPESKVLVRRTRSPTEEGYISRMATNP